VIADLADAVASLSSGTYTVTRTPASAYLLGRKVEPITIATEWTASTAYSLAAQRGNGNNVYEVITAGTSAATPATGPSGTSQDITDGTVHWKWIAPRTSSFTITASVQPVTGRDLDRLPEAMRAKEVLEIYTATELLTSSATQDTDHVSIDGDSYEVHTVERWNNLGNYYRALATRLGR
jgi:hypothetical protein